MVRRLTAGGNRIRTIGPAGMRPTRRVPVLLRADFFGRRESSRGDIQRLVVSRGTDGSNPASASGESATNCTGGGLKIRRSQGLRRNPPSPLTLNPPRADVPAATAIVDRFRQPQHHRRQRSRCAFVGPRRLGGGTQGAAGSRGKRARSLSGCRRNDPSLLGDARRRSAGAPNPGPSHVVLR
jgi:hypothetical protein